MYNLRRFIIKHHFVILFILLEVISVLLLANSQRFHRDRMVNTTNDVVGKIYEWSSEVGNYFRLNSANEQLAEENALLRQRLSVVYDTTTCTFDISEGDTLYKYIPAQVVNNSTNQANNYIIINKGKVDGIERDMGVISTDGIVGVVTDVSRHFASVMSLLHSKSVVGVRIKESQELASLKWETNNYRYGMVEDIPTHILLQKGDTILTSSHSYIFPEDLMVGTVEEFYPTAVDALKICTNPSSIRSKPDSNDMNKTVLQIIRFVVLVLFQVLVINHIRLGGYVHPYIYLVFIMLLPFSTPKWQLLVLGFALGLTVDLFTGTPGLHAGATTLMAFCRPSIIKLVSGNIKFENITEPNLGQLGGLWFFRYVLCMVFIHHFALFFLESFSIRLMGQVLLRILLSVPVSIFLIMMILYIFKSEKKRE